MSKKGGLIAKVSQERWAIAQENEKNFWERHGVEGDDWNGWWKDKFDNYNFLENVDYINTILEIGCGPWARNLDLVMGALPASPSKILLEDPLLDDYLMTGKSVGRYFISNNVLDHNTFTAGRTGVIGISQPFEECDEKIIEPGSVDMAVCNNVLDHVFDVEAIINNIYKALGTGGWFIFGQDLTSEPFGDPAGHDDVMHPIKIDHNYLNSFLDGKYEKKLYKILPREEGRNPMYHYGTYIFAGRKL